MMTDEDGAGSVQVARSTETVEHGEPVPSTPELRQQVRQLKRLLAEKAMEVDFFKGALQKVEARRQRSSGSGEQTSTTKSGK